MHRRVTACLGIFLLTFIGMPPAPCGPAERAGSSGSAPGHRGVRSWTVGTELDLLPYLADGYYLSVIAGAGRFRGRIVRTELTVPDFVTDDAFRDDEREVDALILDVYFAPDFVGWWIGPGLERWKGEVTEKGSGLARGYRTDVLTLGGGYTWRFAEHFYLNPWAAVHVPIGGDRDVPFVADTFEIRATPEASVKLGVRF